MIVDLAGRYIVRSNRESGFGRYDIMLEPVDKTWNAYILEFKVINKRKESSLEDTARAALAQIAEKQYAKELTDRGVPAENIPSYALAFEGKEILIDGA
jgi:hypothetical protein